jgi:hypothetical protein
MADFAVDGKIKVSFVPTISNTAAPTTAELNAGTALQTVLTPDGLEISPNESEVDATVLASTFDLTTPGRLKFDITLTGKKQGQGDTDTVHDALDSRSTAGYLVVRRGSTESTAWASTNKVEVYPVTTGQMVYPTGAANELQTWQVRLFNTGPSQLQATVA